MFKVLLNITYFSAARATFKASCNCVADFSNWTCSSFANFHSIISSIPFAPITAGTPMYVPLTLYSPSHFAPTKNVDLSSFKIAFAIDDKHTQFHKKLLSLNQWLYKPFSSFVGAYLLNLFLLIFLLQQNQQLIFA